MANSTSKREVLHSQTRRMVARILDYFQREKQNNGPLLDVQKFILRVSEACQIGTTTVKAIQKEAVSVKKNESPGFTTPGKSHSKEKTVINIGRFDAEAIRRHIYAYYSRKEAPTTGKLLETLPKAGIFNGKRTSLQTILKELGFKYEKLNNRMVLMEKPAIA